MIEVIATIRKCPTTGKSERVLSEQRTSSGGFDVLWWSCPCQHDTWPDAQPAQHAEWNKSETTSAANTGGL